MIIDISEFRKRKDFISEHISPSGNLIIWNYNAKCQWEKAWDKYTLMARGLITDTDGEVIARPFPKFFNLNERPETMLGKLPPELPIITDKLDGSLGILYEEHGNIHIATRGRFDSPQAIWATAWLRDRYSIEDFSNECTYLFEIIYPGNRIVVDYGEKEELVLLAVIEIGTGKELHHIETAKKLNINHAKVWGGSVSQAVASLPGLDVNHEGYVVRYSSGLRVKLKGHEYKRIHKIITGLSTTSIWDGLKNGTDLDEIIAILPSRAKVWTEEQIRYMKFEYGKIYHKSRVAFDEVFGIGSRRDQAAELREYYKDVSGLVFAMLDGKFRSEMIWKMIKPEFKSFQGND